jgi:hypothetical protein
LSSLTKNRQAMPPITSAGPHTSRVIEQDKFA